MDIRWVTAFIDRRPSVFDPAVRFWSAATGSSLSEPRGHCNQFATLIPPDGDSYLRVQRLDTDRGGHLDLHVELVEQFVARAVAVGAQVERSAVGPPVVRSPAGMPCCVVQQRKEERRPVPNRSASGVLNIIDQISVDVPVSRFDQECAFWTGLTGWQLRESSARPEFAYLERPPQMPLRVMIQRRLSGVGPARAHLDFASDHPEGLATDHQALGATVSERFPYWIAMADPSGHPYCITARDPRTGLLDPSKPTPPIIA